MLVYRESIVWSIIANGVVYVKYKNAYKIKLMVLNSQLFPPKFCVAMTFRLWGRHGGMSSAIMRA